MIDDVIGRVIATLATRKLTGDTVLIFTADHGEFLGDHGLLRKGPPPYDQLVRLPFLVSGPGHRERPGREHPDQPHRSALHML